MSAGGYVAGLVALVDPTPSPTATATAPASAAAGATSAQMDSVLALLQGLGTVFAVGLGIVILALAWQAVMVSRS